MVGWKLGKLFPKCLNVVIPEHGSKEGRMIICLAELDLDKPVLRGSKIQLENTIIWVDFKYEHLPLFCCYCGILGHHEKVCVTKMVESNWDRICEGQYGLWLRAPLLRGGKKVEGGDLVRKKYSVDQSYVLQRERSGVEWGGGNREGCLGRK